MTRSQGRTMSQEFPVCFSQTEIGVAANEADAIALYNASYARRGIAARVSKAKLGNSPDWRGRTWMIRELVERAP
jgi:hypothetical protein